MKNQHQDPLENLPPPEDTRLWSAALRAVSQQSFYNIYWKSFSILRAEKNAMRLRAYALRHQVYCASDHEIGALNPYEEHMPGPLEQDEFDERAEQILLIHEQSSLVAGTIRVIGPSVAKPLESFSLQKICGHPLLHMEQKAPYLCEISRFCMAPQFRRRPGDGKILPAYSDPEYIKYQSALQLLRRRIPYAPLGLLRAAFECVMDKGLLDCVMTVDSADLKSLKRLGFAYHMLGPRVKLGLNPALEAQQPIIFNIKNVLDQMCVQNRECWEIVSDRGRLTSRANRLMHEDWQDRIFDEMTVDMIAEKLL